MRTYYDIFALIFSICVISPAYSATLGYQGTILPCEAPCIEYGVMITPGDHMTFKVSVYKFELKKGSELKPSDITKLKTSPSEMLYSADKLYGAKDTLISKYILTLARAAEKVIPKSKQAKTPIFFRLPAKLKDEQPLFWYRSLGKMAKLFASKTLPFLYSSKAVVLQKSYSSPTFKWLALNFLLGNFGKVGTKTAGIVSLEGNLKSEIAFEQSMINSQVGYFFTIRSVPHAVLSVAFLNSPGNENLITYLKALPNRMTELLNPCGPKGLTKRLLIGTKFNTIVGTGDVNECRETIKKAFLSEFDKRTGTPYVNSTFEGNFYGFPDIKELVTLLGCDDCDVLTPSKLDRVIKGACVEKARQNIPSKTYRARANTSYRESVDSHKMLTCLNANFLYVMMSNAYHFGKNQSIYLKRRINGKDIEESLGHVIHSMKLLH